MSTSKLHPPLHYLMECRFLFFQGAVITTFVGKKFQTLVGKNVQTFVQNKNTLDYPSDLDICLRLRLLMVTFYAVKRTSVDVNILLSNL